MKVLSTYGRIHFADDNCWCQPREVECPGCGEHVIVLHRQVEVAPDTQLRMAVFSDQRLEVEPSIGVTF